MEEIREQQLCPSSYTAASLCHDLSLNPSTKIRALARDDPEPCSTEKEAFMLAVLERNPVAFVQRWGQQLSQDQLSFIA